MLRRILSRIFSRGVIRSLTMDTDEVDDMLYYSHSKLSKMIQDKGDTKAAIVDYLENLKYQPVKDFNTGLEWFNVSEPLSFSKHLKGKVVVLDFFTYCCINCMHIIPDLREIENEFSVEDGLVVIGVHSAKFENEKISSNILSAVQRYNITHPVVNDHDSDMWKKCDVHCWPTLLILGPNANPIVMLMGEGHKTNLQLYIKASLDYYKGKNLISDHKIPFQSAFHLLPDLKGPLLFPGKITNILVDKNEEILAVSDTGNNRILILKPDGTILHQIGSGKTGFSDGPLDQAEFNAPQGLVFLNSDTLFVADTENHAIRRISLKNKRVDTVTGNGKQSDDRSGGKLGTAQGISSPWDVAVYRTPDMDMTFYPDGNPPIREVVIIAMAGTHQIWALFLEDTVWWKCKKYPSGTCIVVAGSGREENRNNLYPQSAAFAQPSGLAISVENKELYVADSESSTIRKVSLVDGKVQPVVGGDRNPQNLFAFGDNDGVLLEAKLQHALGVAVSKDQKLVFVADTYNHKIKRIDVARNSISTLTLPSQADNLTKFSEPAGLCVSASGKKIYLADTNNHAIKILNLYPDFNGLKSVEQISLTESESEVDSTPKTRRHTGKSNKYEVVECKSAAISNQGGKLIFVVNVLMKDGLKLTEDAPQKWSVTLPDVTWSCVPSGGNNFKSNVDVVCSISEGSDDNSGKSKGKTTIDFVFDLVTCTPETCLPRSFIVRVPIVYKKSAKTSLIGEANVQLGPSNISIK